MQETLSPVGEALKRAAHRGKNSSGLTQAIRVQIADQTFKDMVKAGLTEQVLIERTRKITLERTEARNRERQIEAEQRLSLTAELRTLLGEVQRQAEEREEIAEQGRIERQEELIRLRTLIGGVQSQAEEKKRLKDEERASAQQRREAAREAQKQERRLVADKEQKEAAARKAKEEEEREKQRLARQTARAARQEAERQRRNQTRRHQLPNRPLPSEQQNASEEAKAQYTQIGRDFFNISFRPEKEISIEEFIERWSALVHQLHSYSPDQQADLIGRLASGLQISEISLSSAYMKAAGTTDRNGQFFDKVDYLAYTMSDMLGYSGVKKANFLDAIQIKLGSEGRSLSTVHRAVAAWISVTHRESA